MPASEEMERGPGPRGKRAANKERAGGRRKKENKWKEIGWSGGIISMCIMVSMEYPVVDNCSQEGRACFAAV